MSVHQYGEIDLLDSVLSPLFVAATLSMAGIATTSVFDTGSRTRPSRHRVHRFSLAFVLGLGALGAAYGSNQESTDDRDEVETAVVGVMVLSMLGVAFVPIIRDFIRSSQDSAVPVVVINAAGYYLIAYHCGGHHVQVLTQLRGRSLRRLGGVGRSRSWSTRR